jgi:hypothetical protein
LSIVELNLLPPEHAQLIIESQAEKEEMNALMNKWEKKSNGSTDSLLDSDDDVYYFLI